MDLFKLVLGTSPVKEYLAKLARKVIFLKTGYHADVLLNNITVKNENGKVSVHIDTDLTMDSKEFYTLLDKLVN